VAEAVLAAGSTDRAAVHEAFRARNGSSGITGRLEFDETGERVGSPVSLYQVAMADGQREMRYLGTTTELCPDPS
jgi:ABC-type branched-subunit amino acid transport system substrate-binding protein